MEENKEIDISKTIMETIKLLEEKMELIKQVDVNKYSEIREQLDHIYGDSKEKKLNVFETINLLMKLQNETINCLHIYVYQQYAQKEKQLQVYEENPKGFWRRLFEKFFNKFSKLKKNDTQLKEEN